MTQSDMNIFFLNGENKCFHFCVCRMRHFFFIMVVVVILVCMTAMELYSVLTCDKVETKKIVKSPDGKFLQKIGQVRGLKSYSDLSKVCRYESNGKINCPDVRMHGESIIRQIQLAMTRALLIIDIICRKHNIKYWLSSGTLLGAVRDKGFIPWDNDMDISMLRMDYEKFLVVAQQDLPPDLFLQNVHTDPHYKKYQRNEAKVRDGKSCYCLCLRYGCKHHDGLAIDIFVLDTLDKNIIGDQWKRFKYAMDEIFPLRELQFEGYTLYAPNQYEYIMLKEYGNITKIPPESKLCPSKGYIGYPWLSCGEITSKSKEVQTRIIDESRISQDWILYYVY